MLRLTEALPRPASTTANQGAAVAAGSLGVAYVEAAAEAVRVIDHSTNNRSAGHVRQAECSQECSQTPDDEQGCGGTGGYSELPL